MILPNLWKNKTCSKPPTRLHTLCNISIYTCVSLGLTMCFLIQQNQGGVTTSQSQQIWHDRKQDKHTNTYCNMFLLICAVGQNCVFPMSERVVYRLWNEKDRLWSMGGTSFCCLQHNDRTAYPEAKTNSPWQELMNINILLRKIPWSYFSNQSTAHPLSFSTENQWKNWQVLQRKKIRLHGPPWR